MRQRNLTMKINSKIRYALRAMIVIANNPGQQGVLQKDIAENQHISNKYLDTIILSLKKNNLIKNFSGKGSGYVLARPADQISLLDIYTAFESICVVDCIKGLEVCELACSCAAKDCWAEVKNDFSKILSKKLLSQML